ncbi:MAG: DUF262 domain-containing protein [Bacteroidales bacterium]|nr:DUF262 domain-containing protein [Bacteroidales bacterium]
MEINETDMDLFQEITVEDEDVGTTIMEDPFNPSDIDIDTKSPTLSLLMKRLSTIPPEIDLYPDFQRSDDLWNPEKQSRLIESILISFPLPAFYFDGTDDNKWLVVDGLQRLSSLRNFIIDKTLSLKGLEFLKDLETKTFDDLPRPLQRKIEETQIIAYIIKPGTPAKVKYNIFKRINTGGLVLEPQEIRHALNQGRPANFVARLAGLESFKKATGNKISPKKMLDREFVTRFLAFYLNDPEKYVPDLDSYLNKTMSQIYDIPETQLVKSEEDFNAAMILASDIFGDWAFRKTDLYPKRRKPINKALFEVWSVNLARLTGEQKSAIRRSKGVLMSKFVELMKADEKFKRVITSGTGGKYEVLERFGTIKNIINQILQ